jgi:hypothetical protein
MAEEEQPQQHGRDVKLPTFWKTRPEAWFVYAESKFRLKHVDRSRVTICSLLSLRRFWPRSWTSSRPARGHTLHHPQGASAGDAHPLQLREAGAALQVGADRGSQVLPAAQLHVGVLPTGRGEGGVLPLHVSSAAPSVSSYPVRRSGAR